MDEWFKDWFASEYYLEVYNHRDESDAKKICDLILSVTQLQPGSKILDAACGAGRHANYFSSLGYDVTGFDLSKPLLQNALLDASQKRLITKFFCSDIRKVSLKSKFNLVANLFTSFGYFNTDEENFVFIENAFQLIMQSGFYILDYLNPVFIKGNIIAVSSKTIENLEVIEARTISNDRVIKEITIIKNGIEKKFKESVLLYSREKLIKKIESIGFTLKNIYGEYDGSSFDEKKSSRMIMVFQK